MEISVRDTPTREILRARPSDFLDVDRQAIGTCMDFMRVAKKAMGAFYEHFASFGISPGKYSVLMEFAARPPGEALSPSQVAARIGVTRPTMTGLIDGLERQGFVERRMDEEDRRRVTVVMTDRGRRFIDDLMPNQFRRMALISASLTADEHEQLCRLLSKLETGTDEVIARLFEERVGRSALENG